MRLNRAILSKKIFFSRSSKYKPYLKNCLVSILVAERTNTESARDVFDKEQPRTSRTFFREMSEELVSRSYELIPYKPDTRHVVSTLRVSTVVHRDACRFSSPRSVRAKNRNKTCKFNCIASTRFPNERRPHRRTRAPTTSQKFLITRSVIITHFNC